MTFDYQLTDSSPVEWQCDIDQLVFKGSPMMEEVVFFHKASHTLILTDLIENFHPDHFSGCQQAIAHVTGIVAPKGKTPLDWRLSFMFGKKTAKQCLEKMIFWKPKIIIIAHGECIFSDAEKFLKQSFRWLSAT